MAINERLVHTASAAAAGTGNQEEGLILHLDANDVDSYDGDGDIWYDIHDHEYTPAVDPSEHFNTVTYTGTGTTNAITGVGFQPDLIWVKKRNSASNHYIVDSVRGNGTTTYKNLSSNTTDAEGTTTSSGITNSSIGSDGFTMQGTGARTNANGSTYVAWCFKAGGAPTTTNTATSGAMTANSVSIDGVLESSYTPSGSPDIYPDKMSVNTDLGFSVIQYGGSGAQETLPHGLGQNPELMIFKRTNTAASWLVSDGTSMGYLDLNDSFSTTRHNQYINSVDANTIEINNVAGINGSSDEMIAYCFASKRGVSKVGSYIGTGASGNKIYTGFEPAFLLQKETNTSGVNWHIWDNVRDSNPIENILIPNTNSAEGAVSSGITFNRDGFTINTTNGSINGNGDNYIYYAVAKSTNETDLIDDTDLELHLDAGDFPQKGETNYSNTPTTWEDKTSNNYDGTISGAVFDSELGNWLDFDGSNDYVSISSTSTTPVDFSAKNYTIEAWINADTFTNGKPILTKYGTTDANRSIYFSIQSDGTLRLLERSSSSAIHVSTSSISINKWHHVCVSRSSSTVKFYIDGNLDNTISSSFTPNTGGNESINIGSQANGNYNFFSGEIGQVRVYNAALSEEAIRKNLNFTKNDYPNGYNATRIGATFSPSTTPNYWSFDGNNDSMLLSTTSNLLGDTNNIKTISGFVTLSSATARGFIYSVSASNNSNDYFYIGWLGDNNKVYVASRDGSSSNSFTHTAPLTGVADTWKHICVTGGDGNAPKIYVNGVELTVTSSTSGSATNASWIDYPSYSGTVYTNIAKLRQASPGSTHWHNGRIGQVKLYDKTLSSTEVLALFNAEKDIYGL